MAQRPQSAHSSISPLSSAISLPQIQPSTGVNSQAPNLVSQTTNLTAHGTGPNTAGRVPSTNPSLASSASAAPVNPPSQSASAPPGVPASPISNSTNTVDSPSGTAATVAAPATHSSGTPASSNTSPTTNATPSKHNSSRYVQYFDNWWAWEILAGLLATICLLIIIILLAVFDGKPQPELRWGITLNALIALITTVMKGAMLTPLMEGVSQLKWVVFAKESRPLMDFNVYDGASRGGLNALTLMWYMRKRFWREATAFAALFYFLSFGVDTFVQQLIQTEYRDDVVDTSNAVTLRYAQRYDSFDQQASNQGSIVPDAPDADMTAAIYTPLYATKDTDQSDLFSCPESNCTYPITPSLAICGACHDLASKVIKTTSPGGDTYSLPRGPDVGGVVSMNVTSTMEPARTNSFTDQVALIAAFAYVNSTNILRFVDGEYIDDPPKAGECALFPCVQEYRAEVRRDILNQTVVRQWSKVEPRRTTNSTAESIGQWDYYDDIRIQTPGMQGTGAGLDFNMSITAFLGLRKVLPPLIFGDAVMGTSGGVEGGVISTSPIIQRIYATSNMTEYIQRVADSMTSSVRRHPATEAMINLLNVSENEPVPILQMPEFPGEALRQLPFTQIEWPWIVLPIITVLFSNAFLIFSILKSKTAQRNLGVGVWKSSCLPMFYHGLDGNAFARANIDPAPSTSIAYMEDNAGQLRVRLNAAGNGIRLS